MDSQLDEKLADLELLVEVSQLLTLTDLDGVLNRVIKLASDALGGTRTSLFLHDDQGIDWKHIFTASGLSADESVKVVTRVMDEGFAGWVYRHQRGDIIQDTQQDERWIIFPGDTLVVRSVLGVPFVDEGRVIATATFVHPEPHHFTPYHLRLMTIIANQATIAIRNARLFHTVTQQQRQLELVLHAMGDVLLVLDEQGRVMLTNRAALQLASVNTQADLIRKRIHDLARTDAVFDPVVKVLDTADVDRDTWIFEARSELGQRDYRITMSRWRDETRDQGGFVVVLHDITTLRDLYRFKDEMLRVASHDLRSPLSLISGYADMIQMDTPDPESPFHEYVSIIKKCVERMGNLIDDLLRVERIRTSPLELHEQVDIEALVKIVLVNTRPFSQTKNHKLLSELDLPKSPRLNADPVLIRQAMENLINNAIKYTDRGGKIVVRAYVEGQKFHFSVHDTGVGIAPEDLHYVFEAFFRVHPTTAEKGSGLGLSLVKTVIDRHHGEVWVKSQPDKGSQFGFWLPLIQPEDDTHE